MSEFERGENGPPSGVAQHIDRRTREVNSELRVKHDALWIGRLPLILKRIDAGVSLEVIGSQFGVQANAIKRVLRKHGHADKIPSRERRLTKDRLLEHVHAALIKTVKEERTPDDAAAAAVVWNSGVCQLAVAVAADCGLGLRETEQLRELIRQICEGETS